MTNIILLSFTLIYTIIANVEITKKILNWVDETCVWGESTTLTEELNIAIKKGLKL